MMPQCLIALKMLTNSVNGSTNFYSINTFDIVDQLPIDKNLYRTVIPFIFLIIFLLIYKFHQIKYSFGNRFIKNFTPENSEKKQLEIFLRYFEIQNQILY